MDIEYTEQLLGKLEKRGSLTHRIIAHANARYVLFNVNEPQGNHPPFLEHLNDKINSLSFSYLSIGAEFIDLKDYEKGAYCLRKAASLIEHSHLPIQNRSEFSIFYILLSAITYYAASEYSKAFIVLSKIDSETELSILISSFLRKKFAETINEINYILLEDNYANETDTEQEYNERMYNVVFAKAISCNLEYLMSGDEGHLRKAHEILNDLYELTKIDRDPSLWWIVRLFRIILDNQTENSFWETIPPRINPDNDNSSWRFPSELAESFSFLKKMDNETLIKSYIEGLAHNKAPIVELFISQRAALDKVLSEGGSVISLPTSSGKTRIAEIAILKSLINDKLGKILYLAPFRSLAYEVEEELSNTFIPLNYSVSHLYGGSQFSKLDQTLIDEAHILVSTPEKAKAILRANRNIANDIKLIIIDEGHLLGTNRRYVTNELFIEELKLYVRKTAGKIILLSAVLPNTEEISEWITGEKNNVVINNWRPSSQRIGLLQFNGRNVDLDWTNSLNDEEIDTFNKNFIEPFSVANPKRGMRKKSFPKDKAEAISITAVQLTKIGSVLVFVGSSPAVEKTVYSYAKNVQLAFRDELEEVNWGQITEWQEFKLVCKEYYGEDNLLTSYARYGIICHHGKFPNAVRVSVDRLLKVKKAKVVIATSTLAQGVNIGVSSVIFANLYIAGKELTKNDFWNIAGRAGRAFVDTEGKILIATDKSVKKANDFKPAKSRTEYLEYLEIRSEKIKYDEAKARDYISNTTLNDAQSGFLSLLSTVLDIAEQCNIDFDTLLQLISENDFSRLKTTDDTYDSVVLDFFDWTDDILLAIEMNSEVSDNFIDIYFRNSLAYIQANSQGIEQEDLISILKSRREAVLKIADTPEKRIRYVASGLPLSSVAKLEDEFDKIIEFTDTYLQSSQQITNKLDLLSKIEEIMSGLPSSSFSVDFDEVLIKRVREVWISGDDIHSLTSEIETTYSIVSQYFSFTVPWVLNAISNRFKNMEQDEEGDLYAELAVLCELGLPNFNAAKVYLAGIKSRIAAIEISDMYNTEFVTESNTKSIAKQIIKDKAKLIEYSKKTETNEWLDILEMNFKDKAVYTTKIENFYFSKDIDIEYRDELMHIRKYNSETYFVNSDYSVKERITSSKELRKIVGS